MSLKASVSASAGPNEQAKLQITIQGPDILSNTNHQTPRTSRGDDDEWKTKFQEQNRALIVQKLVQCTKYKDKPGLEQAIGSWEESKLADCEQLKLAKRELDILTTKQALVEATRAKDIALIKIILEDIKQSEDAAKKTVVDVKVSPTPPPPPPPQVDPKTDKKKQKTENAEVTVLWQVVQPTPLPTQRTYAREDDANYHKKLIFEISEARKVLGLHANERGKMSKVAGPALKMDKNTMSEIKSYSRPPNGLHDVMKAVFLFLGEDEEKTHSWGTCAQMTNPNGAFGLARRLYEFDVYKTDSEIVARILQILEGVNLEKLKRATSGGETFYIWLKGNIEQYLEKNSLDDVLAAGIERQREIFRSSKPKNPPNPYFKHPTKHKSPRREAFT